MSASKNLIRNELLAQLERINRTSRVLKLQIPGTQRRFRMPEPFPEQDDHIAEAMSILRQLDVVIRMYFSWG